MAKLYQSSKTHQSSASQNHGLRWGDYDSGHSIPLQKNRESKFIKLASFALITFLVTFLSASVLTPPQSSSAEEYNLLASTSDTTYSLTLTSSGTTLNIGATPGGSLTAAVDTVNVITNNPYGYQLYLSTNSTDSNSNRLYLDGDPTKTYFSPTSGTFLNPQPLSSNSWGYALAESDASAIRTKLSQTATTYFDSTYSTTPDSSSVWASVPTKGSEQLIKSASTATSDSGTSTEVYYAASATTALKPGTYSGTVLYTLIAESGASTETASVSPSTIDANTENQSITISTPLPADASKIGDITVTIGSDNTCTVTNKSNNTTTSLVDITCTAPALAEGTYTITVSIPFYDKTYTLENSLTYENAAPTLYELANGKNLQDMTSAICAAAAVDTAETTNFATLTDTRDSQTYRIAKLADGNCWMIDNLRLGSTITSSGSITLTSSNSNVSSNVTISSSNVKTSSTGSWSSNDYDVLHIYARQASETDSNGNPYGNLYNWYTATATTGTQNGVTSGDTNYSICPAKWRLPSNTGNPSYTNLFQTSTSDGGMGLTATSGTDTTNFGASATVAKAPYSFPIAGRWTSGSLRDVGSYGGYWSRTASSANYAYYFYFYSIGRFLLQDYSYKYNGFSVRCVFSG